MAPGDLLVEIAMFLETRLDILNFCLTVSKYPMLFFLKLQLLRIDITTNNPFPQSQDVFSNVSPVLYETVVLQSAEQCSLTLGMLRRRFDIARHVRELVIRPRTKYNNHFTASDNASVSSIVRQLAGTMCLDALVKFQWDAEEMPFYEDMWFALRLGCVPLCYPTSLYLTA